MVDVLPSVVIGFVTLVFVNGVFTIRGVAPLLYLLDWYVTRSRISFYLRLSSVFEHRP